MESDPALSPWQQLSWIRFFDEIRTGFHPEGYEHFKEYSMMKKENFVLPRSMGVHK
jgi:hypothetical protein